MLCQSVGLIVDHRRQAGRVLNTDQVSVGVHRKIDGVVEKPSLTDEGLLPGVEVDLPDFAGIGALHIARFVGYVKLVAGSRRR